MTPVEQRVDNQFLLFDADAGLDVGVDWFDPQYLYQQDIVTATFKGGRGDALEFSKGDDRYVLRHYWRGGYIARWVDDLYLWQGLARTRAWREWHLLAHLAKVGLPAPRPAGACVSRAGIGYRADLITASLAGAVPLSSRIETEALASKTWYLIGETIRRFHDAGVYHPDLTVDNILLDVDDVIYLIDFDKAEVRAGAAHWKRANIARLRRGFDKQCALKPGLKFGDPEWESLLAGYRKK